jgi:hypothetical protein
VWCADFIGQEFSDVIGDALSQRSVMLIAAVPLVLLSWLRSLKSVPASTAASAYAALLLRACIC